MDLPLPWAQMERSVSVYVCVCVVTPKNRPILNCKYEIDVDRVGN